MSNVPLPPIYENHAGKWIDVEDARAHAAAVSAADNATLRAERDNMAGAIAQLLRDNRDVHEKVVRPLRERVRVLEDALRGLDEAYCRAGSPLTKAERHQDRMRLIAARAALEKP